MNPTVSQQLESMKTAMERVIMPALPPDARFAQEQAGLIWATLGWLVDVHESEFRYELDEATDYRQLLQDIAALPGAQVDAALLVEDPAGVAGDLAAVREQARRLKAAAISEASRLGDPARDLVLTIAERQSAREQAWFRMTGFTATDQPGGIAEVLATM